MDLHGLIAQFFICFCSFISTTFQALFLFWDFLFLFRGFCSNLLEKLEFGSLEIEGLNLGFSGVLSRSSKWLWLIPIWVGKVLCSWGVELSIGLQERC